MQHNLFCFLVLKSMLLLSQKDVLLVLIRKLTIYLTYVTPSILLIFRKKYENMRLCVTWKNVIPMRIRTQEKVVRLFNIKYPDRSRTVSAVSKVEMKF